MPINLKCRCGQRLQVKSSAAGKRMKCPKCKAPFTVPSPKAAQPKQEAPAPADDLGLDDLGALEPTGSAFDQQLPASDPLGMPAPAMAGSAMPGPATPGVPAQGMAGGWANASAAPVQPKRQSSIPVRLIIILGGGAAALVVVGVVVVIAVFFFSGGSEAPPVSGPIASSDSSPAPPTQPGVAANPGGSTSAAGGASADSGGTGPGNSSAAVESIQDRLGAINAMPGFLVAESEMPVVAWRDDNALLTANKPGVIEAWDRASESRVQEAKPELRGRFTDIATSPQGDWLAAADAGGNRLLVLDAQTLEVKQQAPAENPFRIAVSPDGKLIAAAAFKGPVSVFNSADLSLRGTLPTNTDDLITGLSFLPDSLHLVTVPAYGDAATLFNVQELAVVKTFEQKQGLGFGGNVVVFPDGQRIAFGRQTGLTVWNRETGESEQPIREYCDKGLAISPDGELIASSDAYSIVLWKTADWSPICRLHGHPTKDIRLNFSPTGSWLASTDGHWVRLWDVERIKKDPGAYRLIGDEFASFALHGAIVDSVAISPKGEIAASNGEHGELEIYSFPDCNPLHSEKIYNLRHVDFMPGGGGLGLFRQRRGIDFYDLATHKATRSLAGNDWFQLCGYTNDGKQALILKEDAALMIDTASGDPLRTFAGHTGGITEAAVSPDGQFVATAGEDDHKLLLWRADGMPPTTLLESKGIRDMYYYLAFSPDGRWLAGGTSRLLQLWNTKTWQEEHNFSSQAAGLQHLAFSPDGIWLAMGINPVTSDGLHHGFARIDLLDIKTGRKIARLKGHTDKVTSIAFSPDGNTMLSGSWDEYVKAWDLSKYRGN